MDASVLAVTERLREPKLATLDLRHLSVVRPRHVKALELLPEQPAPSESALHVWPAASPAARS